MWFFTRVFKGNVQFVFLCYPQKSGPSKAYITYPQITKKILTKDIIHWLELITEILSFLQIFSVRQLFSLFTISENLQESQQKSDIFWTFNRKLQIVHEVTYIHCFFLTLINAFYHASMSVCTIFSFCVFIFSFFSLHSSPRDTFYNLQCLIRFHCSLPVISRR